VSPAALRLLAATAALQGKWLLAADLRDQADELEAGRG
jgi:hypothetical protein